MNEEIEMLIAMAASLERERASRIVKEVSNERIGGKCEEFPTGYMAGYQMACEEIQHRIEHEEWQYNFSVFGNEDDNID